MQFSKLCRGLFGLLAVLLVDGSVLAADALKIGYLDPLSGPFANVGEYGAREMLLVIEAVNTAGGVLGGTKFELETFDTKSSPQEALISLKQMTDKGIRYFFMGNGSKVAGCLPDAVSQHNARKLHHANLFLHDGAAA